MAKVAVKTVESEAEREALYAFRYKIYVEELGMTDVADHGGKLLHDDYDDDAMNYALFEDGRVVGALRGIRMDAIGDPAPLIEKFDMKPALDAFGAAAIGTTSRFLVARHLRNTMVIFQLLRAAFLDSQRLGIRLNYGDCSPHLLPFYEQLGYRRYTDGFDDTAFGYKLPILMLIRDRAFFERVRSPLAKLFGPEDDDAQARSWFGATYPDYADLTSAAFMPDDVFFDLLAERVSTDPLHSIALLRDLSKDEAQQFLGRATIVTVKAGDRVVRQGDRDNTLYAVLSGLAEVRVDGADGPPLAVFGGGDTFGEIGFLTTVPRTANVIARTKCEVLVLSGDFMQRFIAAEPAIGARVLHNLARELAGRLAVATQRFVGEV